MEVFLFTYCKASILEKYLFLENTTQKRFFKIKWVVLLEEKSQSMIDIHLMDPNHGFSNHVQLCLFFSFICCCCWYRCSVSVGSCLEVVLRGNFIGAAEEVQDQDVADVQLGKVPAVICNVIQINLSRSCLMLSHWGRQKLITLTKW